MEIVHNTSDFKNIEYNVESMILVDKPMKWTSFDVVNKMRYNLKHHYGVKKIKVGHAGTLDPLATGLLIICTGKGTKRIEEFQGLNKKYEGVVKLGCTTKSYDAEDEEENHKDISHLTEKEILEAFASFEGEIQQYPPMYSALKVDGQALYKWARKGIKKEIKPRSVHFYELKVTKIELPFVYFCSECSKGTYIRSLAYDVGEKLNVGGYLAGLKRTAIGEHKLEDAVVLEDWIAAFSKKEK